MTDTKRIKECKRKIIAAINEAKIPYAVSELVLENVLAAVRENMVAEEAAAANIETPKTEEEFLSTLSLRRATAKVHKTVGHFCAYETNFMGIASSC